MRSAVGLQGDVRPGRAHTRLLIGVGVGVLVGIVLVQVMIAEAGLRLSAQLGIMWLGAAGLLLRVTMSGMVRDRRSFLLALVPAMLLLGIGVLLPPLRMFFFGAGVGWAIVGPLVVGARERMQYQAAVRLMRRGDYPAAIAAMDRLVAAEPDAAEHRRFRAELYRLAGDLPRSAADYRRVIRLAPGSSESYISLAEIAVQQGDLASAREWVLKARDCDPHGWAAPYTLGLIADRIGDSDAAVAALEQAFAARIPQRRDRVLAHLWLVCALYRRGQFEAAAEQVRLLRQESDGLLEWGRIFESEHAGPLREQYGADVAFTERLCRAESPLEVLAEGKGPG